MTAYGRKQTHKTKPHTRRDFENANDCWLELYGRCDHPRRPHSSSRFNFPSYVCDASSLTTQQSAAYFYELGFFENGIEEGVGFGKSESGAGATAIRRFLQCN